MYLVPKKNKGNMICNRRIKIKFN